MNRDDLKLFTQCFVEAQSPSKIDKEFFNEFVEKAENHQLINFIITGRPEFVSEIDASGNIKIFQESNIGALFVPEFNTILFEGPALIKGVTASIKDVEIPQSIVKMFWNLSKKVTGKKPFTDIAGVEVWLRKADSQEVLKMTSNLLTGSTGIGVVAVLAIMGYILKKIMVRNFSRAARVCREYSGKEKTACMYKYKVSIIKDQISTLEIGRSMCNKTKDPQICISKMNKRIISMKNKLDKLIKKGKLDK